MEMSKLALNGGSLEQQEFPLVKTKPEYSKTTFLWELESIEDVLHDGVPRAIYYDLVIPSDKESKQQLEGNPFFQSKWRLSLDMVDVEPAITIEKISPVEKSVYFRLAVQVMKSPKEETDIISFPNTKLFYEGLGTHDRGARPKEQRTFSLHKQLDYGCSHAVWLKEVLIGQSLLLRVDFETCTSLSTGTSY